MKNIVQPLRNPLSTQSLYITKAWSDYFTALDKRRPETVIFGTHAERISDEHDPINHDVGTQFYEIDRGLLYIDALRRIVTFVDADSSSGTTTLNVDDTTGFVVGQTVYIALGTAREERRTVASISAGVSIDLSTNLTFNHLATDHDSVVSWSTDRVWNYVLGTMEAPLSMEPTDLTADDAGVPYRITTGTAGVEYYHLAQWNGAGWDAVGEWGGYIRMCTGVPVGPGWVFCNVFATTTTLGISAGVLTETSVDIGNFSDGVYFKGSPGYGSLVTPYDPGTMTDFTASGGGSVTVQSGTGATAASTSHTHGAGTLKVNDLDMKHAQVLPYFRR